jgi:hypothetical protein
MATKSKKVIAKQPARVSAGGVYFRKDKKRYVARFTLNGKRVNVGSFISQRSAVTALNSARRTAMSA